MEGSSAPNNCGRMWSFDLNMPGVSGSDALRLMLQDSGEVHVLMLTVRKTPTICSIPLRAGATGYLLKNIEADTLANAIRMADARRAGDFSTHDEQVACCPARAFKHASRRRRRTGQTHPRERDILVCVAKGLSKKLPSRATWRWPKAPSRFTSKAF